MLFKILYLFILAVSTAFFILYEDILSLILLFILIAIPVLLFVAAALMRFSLKVECELKKDIVARDEKALLNLTISNRFLLPITQIKLYALIKNSFFENPDKIELAFCAAPFSKATHEIELESKHTGNVEIVLVKAKVFDYLGLFSFPLKIQKSFTVSYLPKIHHLDVGLRSNLYTLSETEVFSKHKAGDDPSEVFAIREYAAGDKLNRIHWKLSSKQDNFLIKDYSLPINESVLILPEFIIRKNDETDLDLIDGVLEVLSSLSNALITKGIAHTICWYNSSEKIFCHEKVESLDNLYSALGLIFGSTNYYFEPYLTSVDRELQKNISNVIYISPNTSELQCQRLSSSINGNILGTVVNLVGENQAADGLTCGQFNIVNLKPDAISASLDRTIF